MVRYWMADESFPSIVARVGVRREMAGPAQNASLDSFASHHLGGPGGVGEENAIFIRFEFRFDGFCFLCL